MEEGNTTMKGKIFKLALAFTTTCSLLGANAMASFAATQTTTGLDTEYDMLELERAKPGDELITNGDFENGTNGWQFKNSQVTDYDGAAYDGEKCGLLPVEQKDSVLYQNLTLKPNTTYIAKAKVAIGQVGGEANFNLKTNWLGTTVNPGVTISCTSEDQKFVYQDVEFEFNTGNYTDVQLCVMKWTEKDSGPVYQSQVYVDNMSLSEVVTGETEDEVYEVIWKDEFDGETGNVDENGLNLDDWGYELGSIRGVEQQHYTNDKENVHVTDGKLVLEVTDRDEQYQYQNPRGSRQVIYNSGSVRTHGKQEFLYGRIEILAKLPEGQATFPAFWTLGSDFTLDGAINDAQGDGWPVSGEIDIMESIGNPNVVYETLHYASVEGDDAGKYAGNGKTTNITTEGVQIDGETYHVFGINWSENVMEWYVDDQIVRTVDYSDDPVAQAALNRPQYIQLNFATGGNWPGDAGTDLAGQKFEIEYVYYAQNQEQKEAAANYYANTVAVDADDVTIIEGTVADLLDNVTLVPGSDSVDTSEYTVDYSIDNEYMFTSIPDLTDGSTSNDTNQTKVERVVDSDANKEMIASLAPGEYNIHYSAMHPDKPSVRKTVKLTIVEAPDKTELETVLDNADLEVVKDDTYTLASREALSAAIKSARAVFMNPSATDEEVATALASLNNAIASLQLYVAEDDVNDLVDQGNSLVSQTGEYTQESLDKLNTALNALKAAIDSKDKEAIEVAYANVNDAINGLEKVEATDPEQPTTDPEDPDTPVVTPDEPNNTGGNGSVTTTTPSNSSAVKTGDDAMLASALLVLMASGAGVVLLRKNKKC